MKTLWLLLLLLLPFSAARAEQEADSLKKCAETSGLAQTSGFRVRQEIIREGQSPRTFVAECHLADKAEKLLVAFDQPADMAGFKLLFKERGKQLWTYSPLSNRVRKMAGVSSGQSIGTMGFSYDDLFPFLEDTAYKATIIGEEDVSGKKCKILEIKHVIGGTSPYKKVQVYVDPAECIIRKSCFYGDNNRLLKSALFLKYETVEGKTVPAKVRVSQPDRGEETILEVLAIEFGKNYGPAYFSEISLIR